MAIVIAIVTIIVIIIVIGAWLVVGVDLLHADVGAALDNLRANLIYIYIYIYITYMYIY